MRKDASDAVERERLASACGSVDRDSRGVATRAQDRGMTIQLTCPWCTDEVTFTIDEADEELVCSGCATHMDFAPDPGVTYELLYASAA